MRAILSEVEWAPADDVRVGIDPARAGKVLWGHGIERRTAAADLWRAALLLGTPLHATAGSTRARDRDLVTLLGRASLDMPPGTFATEPTLALRRGRAHVDLSVSVQPAGPRMPKLWARAHDGRHVVFTARLRREGPTASADLRALVGVPVTIDLARSLNEPSPTESPIHRHATAAEHSTAALLAAHRALDQGDGVRSGAWAAIGRQWLEAAACWSEADRADLAAETAALARIAGERSRTAALTAEAAAALGAATDSAEGVADAERRATDLLERPVLREAHAVRRALAERGPKPDLHLAVVELAQRPPTPTTLGALRAIARVALLLDRADLAAFADEAVRRLHAPRA